MSMSNIVEEWNNARIRYYLTDLNTSRWKLPRR